MQGEEAPCFEMLDLIKCERFLATFQRFLNTLLFINLLNHLMKVFLDETVINKFKGDISEQRTFISVARTSDYILESIQHILAKSSFTSSCASTYF